MHLIILGILQIKNLSAMEVNIVRPFIGRALQAFYKHDSPELIPDPERVSDRRPQVVNNAPRVRLIYTLGNIFHSLYIIFVILQMRNLLQSYSIFFSLIQIQYD